MTRALLPALSSPPLSAKRVSITAVTPMRWEYYVEIGFDVSDLTITHFAVSKWHHALDRRRTQSEEDKVHLPELLIRRALKRNLEPLGIKFDIQQLSTIFYVALNFYFDEFVKLLCDETGG
ncbi:hypothetical protein GGS23DRAFT_596131 [Durotheca rogersii]|uniref:uncharacterized protein n=1 Tax=Durotheca rogersii TaxID=419775 RepID=UPI00221ED512|nr:uncharacterized protein GGS23DRAFT_596131 [Durotheca rogersii]KAI5863623.1 hypothetical protein GGS23DRAFT_596131 [Durotheca rogersii]